MKAPNAAHRQNSQRHLDFAVPDASQTLEPAPLHEQIDRLCTLSMIRQLFGRPTGWNTKPKKETYFPQSGV
jgi:hypothetical protein